MSEDDDNLGTRIAQTILICLLCVGLPWGVLMLADFLFNNHLIRAAETGAQITTELLNHGADK